MSNIKSICGDICKVSDQIEDNSIDLLLTDPPYNISREGNQTVWMKDGKNISVMHNMKFDKDFSDSWDTLSKDEFKNNLIVSLLSDCLEYCTSIATLILMLLQSNTYYAV